MIVFEIDDGLKSTSIKLKLRLDGNSVLLCAQPQSEAHDYAVLRFNPDGTVSRQRDVPNYLGFDLNLQGEVKLRTAT